MIEGILHYKSQFENPAVSYNPSYTSLFGAADRYPTSLELGHDGSFRSSSWRPMV